MGNDGTMGGHLQDEGDVRDGQHDVVAALPKTWAIPQGLGPRATSQWPIMQRLADDEWKVLMQALPGRVGARARQGGNARRFIEAVLWVAQTGAYWSDLPRDFGSWHGIYVRFIRWTGTGRACSPVLIRRTRVHSTCMPSCSVTCTATTPST